MPISASGIGSGIDVASIVSALVGSRQQPKDALFDQQSSKVSSQISALGSVQSKLDAFQTALNSLTSATSSTGSITQKVAVTSVDTFLSATADKNAPNGSYNVKINSLAQADKKSTNAIAPADIGAGTLDFSVAGKNTSIAVNAGDSLDDIAAAINASADAGFTASVVNGDAGSSLIFTANDTGSANAISVTATSSASDPSNNLVTNFSSLNSLQTAQNASITVDGIDATSASNSISGVIPGVTLSLNDFDLSSNVNNNTTINVKNDNSSTEDALQSFADAYNALRSSLDSVSGYDPDTKAAGPLQGNSLISNMKNQMAKILSSAGSVGAVGLNLDKDGKLTLDKEKLDKVLSSPNGVATVENMFTNPTDGIATKFTGFIGTYNGDEYGSTGLLATQNTSYTNAAARITKDKAAFDASMSRYSERLTKQYNHMDSVIAGLNSQSSYITGILANLPGLVSSK